ncbi:RodZ domain-containing protein [Herbaspirillum sp. GCM10030257]|uniref:RodZ domain-containing protein n=1 Tax=Herbaspirillum sp. GCM10030257 TaxID=3273393 RepID=UPI003622EA46
MSEPGVNDPAMPEHMPTDHAAPVSPGAQLAACRQERGWTIEQVASHLNLAPRQVAAIEADDYPSLPGMAIVRGFVRQYAKLLKIDAAPLLASLGGETVLAHESIRPRQSLSTPFSEARLPSMTERHASSSRWVLGALLLIVAGAVAWALLKDKNLADMSDAATSQVKSGIAQMTSPVGTSQPSDAASAPATSEPAASVEAGSPVSEPAHEVAPATTGTNGSSATPSQAGQSGAVQSAMPAADATLASPGKDALVIKARQDSWLEIKPEGASKPAVSRLMKAGESETFEVTGPVSVVIGNASGVDANLRGSAIELKAPGSGNVARLKLK